MNQEIERKHYKELGNCHTLFQL